MYYSYQQRSSLGKSDHIKSATLIYAAFIAGLCSIVYELLIATTAAYFLGDSVKYFSLTIGMYMAAMGTGAYVSKYIDKALLRTFVIAELWLGVVGGLSIPLLYIAYAYLDMFIPVYVILTLLIGFLIGLEIPFLTRLMEEYKQLKFTISTVLTFDYMGALIATVSFPFILLPLLGVYQSSLLFGMVNMSIGLTMLWVFKAEVVASYRYLVGLTILFTSVLVGMFIFSGVFLKHWDSQLYEDRVIESQQTRYQKIVLTKHKEDVRLYLDGNLQFSSIDEHRYHEALVHVPLALQRHPVKRVLLLGAGDGLAVRELLKYPAIEEIVLVDLDEAIVTLAKENRYVSALNQDSLSSPKVKITIADAFSYLGSNDVPFDMIISDLPDPNNNALARLYSKQFYGLVKRNLHHNGVFVTQATSPYFATQAFWSIAHTLSASGFETVKPYHVQVPSFGDWGYIMAMPAVHEEVPPALIPHMRFLDEVMFDKLFVFAKDMQPREPLRVNTIDQPVLLNDYLKGWKYYGQ